LIDQGEILFPLGTVDAEKELDRDALRELQRQKLSALLARIAGSGSFYARRLAADGVSFEEVADISTFVRRVRWTTKDELLRDRLEHPPFGTQGLEAAARYNRFCQTSGTSTGQPMAWLDTPESWQAMLDCWGRVYEAAELVPGVDRVFFAFSFGPFLGFWTAFEAAAQTYMALPGGGLSSQARLECLRRYQATVLCCTPTYALRLGEQIGAASGVELEELAVKKVIVAGEPGGCVPALRRRIEALWGARVFDHHGMTEVGPVSYEAANHPGGLMVIEEAYLAEVVNAETGEEVAEGECGELVLTTLDRCACPLLRYRTGDWVRKRIVQGRLFLEGGILCRVDDMVVVRGVNLYPAAVEEVVRGFPEVVEFQVEQREVEAMTELMLRVELVEGAEASVLGRLEARLRDTFSLRIPVGLAAADSLPRHEFKSNRWRKVASGADVG
jgi:phenylacetate-CoA ligase